VSPCQSLQAKCPKHYKRPYPVKRVLVARRANNGRFALLPCPTQVVSLGSVVQMVGSKRLCSVAVDCVVLRIFHTAVVIWGSTTNACGLSDRAWR